MGAPPVLPGAAVGAPELSLTKLLLKAVSTLAENPVVAGWLTDLADKVTPKGFSTWYAWRVAAQADFVRQLAEQARKSRAQYMPALLDVAAAAISDAFGIQVTRDELGLSGGSGGRRAVAQRIGNLIFDQLFTDIAQGGDLTQAQALSAGKRVLGQSTLMAIDGWLAKAVGGGPLLRDIPGIGDLSDLVSRYVGINNVSSQVLLAFISAAILDPIKEAVNATYAPKDPNESQAARLLFRGSIGEDQYFTFMGKLGWPRALAAELKLLNSERLTRSDLRRLLEMGAYDEGAVLDELKVQGFDPAVRDAVLEVIRQDRIHATVVSLGAIARDQFRDRVIEEPEFRQLCQLARFTTEETDALLGVAQIERSRPTRISKADAERAYAEGVTDINALRAYYEKAGYTDADADLLVELAVIDKTRLEARAAVARPKPLPESLAAVPRSVAREAHRRGIITPEQFRAILTGQGVAGAALDAIIAVEARRRADYEAAVKRGVTAARGITASAGTVEEAYVRGLVGDAELLSFYGERGFTGRELELLLALRRQERAEYLARKVKAAAAG